MQQVIVSIHRTPHDGILLLHRADNDLRITKPGRLLSIGRDMKHDPRRVHPGLFTLPL
jgi:hypothetical protein